MTTATTRTSPAASGFGYATGLSCRECGRIYPLGPHYACEECFGPLEVCYDYPALTRPDIEAGPPNMWRYAPLLPVPADIAARPTTEPGYTKLIRADNLAHTLGMRRLWVKDDRGNPTHSFKDRVVAVALAAATEMGFKVLACPSTGNLANAVAAAAARAGVRSVVMVPADLELQKIITTSVYGGTFITVDGTYDDVNRLASELAGEHPDWAFVNVNVRPYYAEGSKTLGFEIAEQLGWRLPDVIVYPTGGGVGIIGIYKALQELRELGWTGQRLPRLVAVQASGCAPIVKAFASGAAESEPWPEPRTVAFGITVPKALGDFLVLDALYATGGTAVAVDDDALLGDQRTVARLEGSLICPEGAACVTAVRALRASGWLSGDDEVVLLNTGTGLKYPHTLPHDAPAPAP